MQTCGTRAVWRAAIVWGFFVATLGAWAGLACAQDAAGSAPSTPAASVPAATTGAAVASDPPAFTAARAAALWQELTTTLGPATAKSRRILIGMRDPNGPSCVNIAWEHDKTIFASGGPGSQIAQLFYGQGRGRTPKADFTWHQTTFKKALQTMRAENREAFLKASRLADQAEELAAGLRSGASLPDGLTSLAYQPRTYWAGHGASQLDEALARRDLAAAQHWADELASATFALADLHRWLDYLLSNHLNALAFQAKCQSLFDECDNGGPYQPTIDVTGFPAGRLGLRGIDNYLEVEHRAEWLMRVPAEYLAALADREAGAGRLDVAAVASARWMPPNLRAAFVALRGRLSPENQRTWDAAAHTPFERSYLANMLYRTMLAKVDTDVAVVLDRFNARRPQAALPELMAAIFYRGGEPVGSGAWDERYDSRLMKEAAGLTGTDEQVLLRAQQFVNRLFGGKENYLPTDSLPQALDAGKLDCLMATDMVGSLYRNAGRTGLYSIRWCAGMAGHTVAAAEVLRGGTPAIVIVDGLEEPEKATGLWPAAYFMGHAWPEGYPGPKPLVYAVELYARGIDNYVWLEGYIVRGPSAGTLMHAPIPYLPEHTKADLARSREGPPAPTVLTGE